MTKSQKRAKLAKKTTNRDLGDKQSAIKNTTSKSTDAHHEMTTADVAFHNLMQSLSTGAHIPTAGDDDTRVHSRLRIGLADPLDATSASTGVTNESPEKMQISVGAAHEPPKLVITPEQATSPEIAEQFNALLAELDGVCRIESGPDGTGEIVAHVKEYTGEKRKYSFGKLPVTAATVAFLARRIELQELKRRLYELEPRMLAVGWKQLNITISDRFSVLTDNEHLQWDLNPASINAVTERLVTAEAKQLLDEHYEEISASGIGLTNRLPVPVSFPSFGFTLRENDHLTIRRLTVDNIKEVIAIARALNELHSD